MGRKKATKKRMSLKSSFKTVSTKPIPFSEDFSHYELCQLYYKKLVKSKTAFTKKTKPNTTHFSWNKSVKNTSKFKQKLSEYQSITANEDCISINLPRGEFKWDSHEIAPSEEVELIKKAKKSDLIYEDYDVAGILTNALKIDPSDHVLQMGSYSESIILGNLMEMKQRAGQWSTSEQLRRGGLFMVNELKQERISMLVKHLAKYETSNVLMVSHYGDEIPRLKGLALPGGGGPPDPKYDLNFYFDKVLLNSSYSRLARPGDSRWKPEDSLRIHHLQVALLEQAIRLAQVGGTVIYTTRSMNPMENEAVVAEVFRRATGVESPCLVIEDLFHGSDIEVERGLTRWPVILRKGEIRKDVLRKRSVLRGDLEGYFKSQKNKHADQKEGTHLEEKSQKSKDKDNQLFEKYFACFETYEDFLKSEEVLVSADLVRESHFVQNEEELLHKFAIHKTARFAPQTLRSGPLYVAVITKKSQIYFDKNHSVKSQSVNQSLLLQKSLSKREHTSDIDFEGRGNNFESSVTFSNTRYKKRGHSVHKNRLLSLISVSDEEWDFLKNTFYLPEDFPLELLVKNRFENPKTFTLISRSMYSLLSSNVEVPLRKVFAGLPLFQRIYESREGVNAVHPFEPVYRSLGVICEFVGDKVISLKTEQFKRLVSGNRKVRFDDLVHWGHGDLVQTLKAFFGRFCFLKVSKDGKAFEFEEYLAAEVFEGFVRLVLSTDELLGIKLKFGW